MVDGKKFRDKFWDFSRKHKGWVWASTLVGNSADYTIGGVWRNDLIFFSAGSDSIDGRPAYDTLLIATREVYDYSSEIGEAVPSFAIEPVNEASADTYVYFTNGNHQNRT